MTSTMLSCIYSDTLFTATELNRQPGKILDYALEHPVTITRNDEHFALLRREEVSSLTKAAQNGRHLIELLSAAFRLCLGEKLSTEHPHGWLKVFDKDDLQDFINEVTEAYRSAVFREQAWDELEAIIHEWHESALAIANPEIAYAFSDKDEYDEVPLTQPFTEKVT
ncbi:hypothetical protein [Scytonema sp. NUACC26]|uniref:hypothetical protein n=1 Tax=Scytonema sp. NUACC26 TaxID=3140176 RepID=UPI0034DCA639